MKRTIFMICAAMTAVSASAQELKEKQVPANLREAFAKAYPNVKEVEWEKEGNNFEAEFELKDLEIAMLFDADGNVLETEIEIPEAELPAPAKDHISKNYKGARIIEAARVTAANDAVSYKAELEDKELLFDATGNLTKELSGKDHHK